jgi:hypothetical protein
MDNRNYIKILSRKCLAGYSLGGHKRIPGIEATKRGKAKLIEVDTPTTVDPAQLECLRHGAA